MASFRYVVDQLGDQSRVCTRTARKLPSRIPHPCHSHEGSPTPLHPKPQILKSALRHHLTANRNIWKSLIFEITDQAQPETGTQDLEVLLALMNGHLKFLVNVLLLIHVRLILEGDCAIYVKGWVGSKKRIVEATVGALNGNVRGVRVGGMRGHCHESDNCIDTSYVIVMNSSQASL